MSVQDLGGSSSFSDYLFLFPELFPDDVEPSPECGGGTLVLFPRHRQLPADFGFGQRDGGEGVGVDFAGVVFGQKGDTHMVRHHVGEQVPLSGAADDVGSEALAAAGGLDGFVEGKS